MPSGITHILLMKHLHDEPLDEDLDMIFAAGKDFLQVGAVAPDLPYASVTDNDFFLTTQSELADKFHYVKTNQVPLYALKELKRQWSQLSNKEKRYCFCFFAGYIAHVVADGIFHPYIRDKVGNYSDHKKEHRKLEMQLDVMLMRYLTQNSGAPLELNCTKMHRELEDFNKITYPEIFKVVELFRKTILTVYGDRYEEEKVIGWVTGLYRMFSVANAHLPGIYRKIGISLALLYQEYQDLEKHKDLLILKKPVDGLPKNFLQKDAVHYFEDVLPQFSKKYIPIAQKAYEYIYGSGAELTETNIPAIDLDTGRLLASNQLDLIPTFWS
jgi:hypothetical protein